MLAPGACAIATASAMSASLEPGSVQWMTAGRGIIHSEMPEREAGSGWRRFELWVKSSPPKDKMTAPQ